MPITLNYTFTAATTIQSSQVNDNFTQITNSAPSISAAETISGAWTFSSATNNVTGQFRFDADALHIADTNATHYLVLTPGSNLTANRVLTLTTGDAAVTCDVTAATAGKIISADGTNWAASTLVLPNAITANRVVYGSATGTFGSSANLTFDGTTLVLTGAATVSTTLGVTGAATLSSTLAVTGVQTNAADFVFSGKTRERQ